MRRNRRFTLSVEKMPKDGEINEVIDDRPIEQKAEALLTTFERVGVKIFAGICIYVVLDTHRKVAVAKATYPRA